MEIYSKLSRFFPNQFRQPTGWLGQVVGWLESRRNEAANDFVLANLRVEAGDVVLETGFGPGVTVQKLAKQVGHGKVLGVDFSREMAAQARKRNGQGLREGRVFLAIGDMCAVPLPSNTCNKILGISVFYFLEDPHACLIELRRVLQPGGRIGFYLTSKEDLLKEKFTQVGNFRLYTGEEVVTMLEAAGFVGARYTTTKINQRTGMCVLAEKRGKGEER